MFTPTTRPFPATEIPEVIFDEHPEWVELYQEAWRSAWRHVYESAVTPVSPYMGEGCATSHLWIWDTSLMSFFCRYAFHTYPGIESLDNLYQIMRGAASSMKIHHPDNPPLLAWAELEYFRFTGDTARLPRILEDLENHYNYLESLRAGSPLPEWGGTSPLAWQSTPEGYHWNGVSSGMDNTPRGRDDYKDLLWFDAAAQQGLAARSIAELAEITGNMPLRDKFQAEYRRKCELVQHYWDSASDVFYDRRDGEFCRVLTPAVFWPMAAGMTTPEQARQLAALLEDPAKLGGRCPCPTVSHDDPDFSPEGRYWRGAVWVPLVYMTATALKNYGMFDTAREISRKLLVHMHDTWRNYSPHSIWECYKPNIPEPAISKGDRICRADFCGWSALGPISLFIEHIIGIYEVSATASTIHWRITSPRRHGIRNLRFGDNTVSLVCEDGRIQVNADKPFTLVVNSVAHSCPAGESTVIPIKCQIVI